MSDPKQELIEQYFDKVELKGKPWLVRKSDLEIIPLYQFEFYDYQQIEQIGKGEFTPKLLID